MRRNNYKPIIRKTMECECGGTSKLGNRRNYPFGRKSKAVTTRFYKCSKCNGIKIINKKDDNSKRR